MAEVKTVDPDITILHHAVKFHKHATAKVIRRQCEMSAIPGNPAGQKRARPTSQIGFGKRPGDAPIVRQLDGLPFGIVVSGLLRADNIAFGKPPTVIQWNDVSRGGQCQPGGLDQKAREGCQHNSFYIHKF